MRKVMKRILLVFLFAFLNVSVFCQVTEAAVSQLSKPVFTISNVASSGKIKLTWSPVKKAVSYQVYRSLDGKKWSRLITTKGTTVVNTSAEAGKIYYYKLKAVAPAGMKDSSFSKVKYRACDLKKPSIKLATNSATGKTIITWDKVDKAVSYKVYCSTDNKNWKLLKTMKGTKLTHTSATAGQKYYYKLRAIAEESTANSAYSEVKYRTTKVVKSEDKLSKYQKAVVDLAIDIAENWKTEYRLGEKGTKDSKGVYGFDCSGFSTYVLDTVMVKEIPTFRITSNISKFCNLNVVYNEGYQGECKVQTISKKNMQPGDIIFFSHNKANDHCGIYIGDNKFVHSTKRNGGVAINTISGNYERDLSVIRRYLPTKITAANAKVTLSKSCRLYGKRADDNSKIATLKKGETITILYTGNNPASYNQAYVKTSSGLKGFMYTKSFK